MLKIRYILFFLFLHFFLVSFAQKGNKDKNIGLRFCNNMNKTDTIFYIWENNQGYNKYFICSDNAYSNILSIVELNYDSIKEVVKIIITDNRHSESKEIKFRNSDLSYIVKDDSTYALSINDNDRYRFFITFPELPKKEKIYLNQILTYDRLCTYQLIPLREKYINKHLNIAKQHWKKIKHERGLKEIHEENMKIRGEATGIKDYLSNKENLLIKTPKRANDSLQKVFQNMMDSIFSVHLQGINNISSTVEGHYDIWVNSNKKVEFKKTDPKITKPNTGIDSIPLRLKTEIRAIDSAIIKLPLKNEIMPLTKNDTFPSVEKNHIKRCNETGLEPDFSYFILDSVKRELALIQKQIEVPTMYSYDYKFTLTSRWQKWVKKDSNIIIAQSQKKVDYDLSEIFYYEYSKTKNGKTAKNGKYDIHLNSAE